MFLHSPFEQFIVKKFFYYDSNFILTNMFITLLITFIWLFLLLLVNFSTKKQHINIFIEYFNILYNFLFTLIRSYVGRKYYNTYFPFLFYLFLFILTCNLGGLVPFGFTLTSHFFFNVGLSSIIWIGVLILGIKKRGLYFFALFYPKGASSSLIILLGVIELISWLFRVFSLALRLMANMIAGHVLLRCISFYIYNSFYASITKVNFSFVSIALTILPAIVFVGLFVFEAGVAFLQAYIFIVLSSIYIREVI